MFRSIILLSGIILVSLITLAACNSSQGSDPVGVVQSYILGRVASDQNMLVSLSCKDQESQAMTDADSFKSMKASVDSMTCNQAGTDGAFTLVACQGSISTEYAGESRKWNLADRNFKTIQEDGKWKVCGYQAVKK